MKEYIERADAINLLWLFADESCASVVSDFEGLPAADVRGGAARFLVRLWFWGMLYKLWGFFIPSRRK